MIYKRLYYRFKPYIPWRLRVALRRMLAKRRRETFKAVWPINEAAGKAPSGWSGWPEGKRFAFVLTHDVESQKGLDRSLQLAALDGSLGFRSSFNFIPEGDYPDSLSVRESLVQNGFEIGIHDLKHDGFLYESRESFRRQAEQINQYAKKWQATGFRSAFMHHNLEWFDDLDILYDASTFDTDPFEPQPDGVDTIFPFWVAGKKGDGYVELPYTLIQDFNLFIVLRETSIDVWKKKLDWIVERGGMALLIVHPDYASFSNNGLAPDEFPVGRYAEFLRYVKETYAGQYWNALPCEVAGWYRKQHAEPVPKSATAVSSIVSGIEVVTKNALAGKRAAVVLYSYYANDPRPRREAEALQREGMEVDVICLREDSSEPREEVINGVHVYRIPLKRRRAGKLTYALQYLSFLVSSFLILSWWRLKRRYQLVHVHNMPDFLVFSALLPKILGARVILDLHDPMPELLVTIFGLKESSVGVRLLKFCEKWSIRFADHVLTVNQACKEIFSARSCAPEKIEVLLNVPDESVFKFRDCLDYPARDPAQPFVIMFHGSIVKRNGLDIAVESLRLLLPSVPNAELWVYGLSTPFLEQVLGSVSQNGLAHAVRYLGPKSLEDIVAAIQTCDVGVIPNRSNAFTEINTPTRIFEYLSLGKPVVAPRAKGITDYFGPDDLVYFELGDAASLSKQLEFIFRQPALARAVTQRGQTVYRRECWSQAGKKFLNRVDGLLQPRR